MVGILLGTAVNLQTRLEELNILVILSPSVSKNGKGLIYLLFVIIYYGIIAVLI